MDSIMIIGSAGSVGHDMVYQIASMGLPIKVIGADVDAEKGRFEIEESLHIAHSLGFYPDLSFEKINLFDIDETAEKLERLQPKVICNLASLGSWWITRLLPDEEYKKIGPIGPWLPNHLTLAMKLMQAVKKTGLDIKVVNGAFPDATNVVLDKLGMAPVCGGGNMDLGIFRYKRIIARDMDVPYRNVKIYGVGHHGAFYTKRMDAPFWVKIIVNGEDVTERYPNEKLRDMYAKAGYAKSVQYSGPLVDQMRTAASFLKNVLAVYYDTNELMECVPGPNGLPGAYPCRLGEDGAEPIVPDIGLDKAIEINKAGGQHDGIERIKEDGTVVYRDENVKYMREVVGYDCKELKPSESAERAKELDNLLNKLYEKYKVTQ
ncbi:NAD-dependent epimerase/dehydratase family protein [Candidatus Bathyarchaeota archaeon]|nr:NAD-dependent epimerase/dehydratase family protein [Candidatus Bathyarchaeota archaeon]